MPYGPHTDDDRARMLATIGVSSIDELFADIPAELRASPLDLPEPESELPLSERMQALASRNRVDLASFLGAGAYRHFSPPVVDQMLLRGEWYTAYTPYQPEVSQGTLQSIYEYQTLLAELTGLDVVSASHYDGGAATAEAALMACRATRRERVLVSPAVHPHYRQTLATYFGGWRTPGRRAAAGSGWRRRRHHRSRGARAASRGCRPAGGRGRRGPAELLRAAGAHGGDRGRRPRRRRAPRGVIEPVSLAVLAPPGAYGADIAAGEGQPLGIPLQYGGPNLGILACTDPLVRQIPGRLVGLTHDLDGKRAFVMTLRAREQDIRRERAASNICTNQALLALAASVWLATLGPHGLRDVAALGAARATELEAALAAVGTPRVHPGPYLNELVVRVPDAPAVHARLLDRGVLAGLPLRDLYPDRAELADALLVCATEVTTSDEIARFARALSDELAGSTADAAATVGAA